ncbi:hypothetical protein ACRRTK_019440 [Alexandromys fortis]
MECTEKQVPSGPRDKATACEAPSPGSRSKDTWLFKIPTCGCLDPFSTPKSSRWDLQMAAASHAVAREQAEESAFTATAQPGLPGTQPPPLALLQGTVVDVIESELGLVTQEGKGRQRTGRHDPSPLLRPLTFSFAIFPVIPNSSWGSAGETPVHRALTPELAAPPLPLPGLCEFLTLVILPTSAFGNSVGTHPFPSSSPPGFAPPPEESGVVIERPNHTAAARMLKQRATVHIFIDTVPGN